MADSAETLTGEREAVGPEKRAPALAGRLDCPLQIPPLLLAVDFACLVAGWALIGNPSEQDMPHADLWPGSHIIPLWIYLCGWFAAQGHYRNRSIFSTEFFQIAAGVSLAALLELSMPIGAHLGWRYALLRWVVVLITIPAGRAMAKWTLFQLGPWRLPTVVIGPAAQCAAIASMLADGWYRGFVVRAEFCSDRGRASSIGPELDRLVNSGSIRHVLVVSDGDGAAGEAIACIVRRVRGLTMSVIPALAGLPTCKIVVDRFFGNDLIVLREVDLVSPRRRAFVKRCMDLSIALPLVFLALPVMLLIAYLVRRDGGPAFYASRRLGHQGEPFFALKFRTMAPDAERLLLDLLDRDPQARKEWEAGFKIRHDPRITKIGRFLRELSLDELPQLINVIRGDMSLVGPRPLLPAERRTYGEAFDLYCQCVPGITGPWQVSGRNHLDYKRRIELNTWYANNASFWIDIVILFRTLPVVIRRMGAV